MDDDKLSRFTTPEERANISGINLNESDVEAFLEMMRNGLLGGASAHSGAVQDNFALRAEVTVRLSRPVSDTEDSVTELSSVVSHVAKLRASKEYIDPSRAPKAE